MQKKKRDGYFVCSCGRTFTYDTLEKEWGKWGKEEVNSPEPSCPNCMATMHFIPTGELSKIEVRGENPDDVAFVSDVLSNKPSSDSIQKYILIGTFFAATFFAILGVIFILTGSTGDTEFSFFGQSFKSTHVGIAAIFLASTIIVLNIRQVLKNIERIHQKNKNNTFVS